ncbi:MAG: hypothetical protein RL318_500 [Fibrobacterota bacterium]|jgi:hypothetical protein
MKKSTALALAIAALTGSAFAQDAAKVALLEAKLDSVSEKTDAVKGKLDGIEENYLETKATVDKLAKIKVSGLIQARMEYATDTAQLDAGFGANQARFKVRRGRLKVAHDGTLGDYAVQVQYGEKGIELVDMYGSFQDPWKTVKVRLGAQDIPFGYEIGYSSSMMETMERSLAEQKLFNGEKDLGAVLFLSYDKDFFQYVDFKAGVMNGQMNIKTQENDEGKTFLGRLGFKAPIKDLNFEIDGGASYYMNELTVRNKSVVDYDNQVGGTKETAKIAYTVANAVDLKLEKTIIGADMQAYFNILPFGGTVLRGEMYTGTNVSVANNGPYTGDISTTVSYNTTYTTTADTAKKAYTTKSVDPKASAGAYVRPVMGWYGTLIQNVGDAFQVVARYEQFDPNTELEGSAIGSHNSVKGVIGSADDLSWSQISLGLNYFLSGNVKLSLAYDIKVNETTSAANVVNLNTKDGKNTTTPRTDWSKEIDNNLLTAQLQYKF